MILIDSIIAIIWLLFRLHSLQRRTRWGTSSLVASVAFSEILAPPNVLHTHHPRRSSTVVSSPLQLSSPAMYSLPDPTAQCLLMQFVAQAFQLKPFPETHDWIIARLRWINLVMCAICEAVIAGAMVRNPEAHVFQKHWSAVAFKSSMPRLFMAE